MNGKYAKPTVTMIVTLELDSVPGEGYTSDSHVQWVRRLMDATTPHYHPTVVQLMCGDGIHAPTHTIGCDYAENPR